VDGGNGISQPALVNESLTLEAIVDRTTFIAMTAVLGIVLGVLVGV
jgi:hypothetical protein